MLFKKQMVSIQPQRIVQRKQIANGWMCKPVNKREQYSMCSYFSMAQGLRRLAHAVKKQLGCMVTPLKNVEFIPRFLILSPVQCNVTALPTPRNA